MSSEQEHEIVAAIRDWLAATSDVEVPPGLSREEARPRARELLAAIVAGSVVLDQAEVDDDLKDILWAAVDELDEKPLGQRTFLMCDSFYQFVAALPVERDTFDERDEVLHHVARIGWRSEPGGLEAVLEARATVWEHGDEHRHREVCESANRLQDAIKELGRQQVPEVPKIREICTRLTKLANIYPNAVAQRAVAMSALLANRDRRIGRLDDCEHLKATTALAAGMAGRQLGRWESALAGYARAAAAFRRTAETGDLDRVEVEHLALQLVRGGDATVSDYPTTRIKTLTIPRDRIKAQLIVANALINLGQSGEARMLVEVAQQNPAIQKEPALEAWSLALLGTAWSYEGQPTKAVANFGTAGEVLNRFFHPVQAAFLASSVGEHLGRLGNLEEAVTVYKRAREMFREIGQEQQVGYLSVLISELLIMLGRNSDAEQELRGALPLIEKFELRREATTAIGLLREAVARRRTDMTAIRELRDRLGKGLRS